MSRYIPGPPVASNPAKGASARTFFTGTGADSAVWKAPPAVLARGTIGDGSTADIAAAVVGLLLWVQDQGGDTSPTRKIDYGGPRLPPIIPPKGSGTNAGPFGSGFYTTYYATGNSYLCPTPRGTAWNHDPEGLGADRALVYYTGGQATMVYHEDARARANIRNLENVATYASGGMSWNTAKGHIIQCLNKFHYGWKLDDIVISLLDGTVIDRDYQP